VTSFQKHVCLSDYLFYSISPILYHCQIGLKLSQGAVSPDLTVRPLITHLRTLDICFLVILTCIHNPIVNVHISANSDFLFYLKKTNYLVENAIVDHVLRNSALEGYIEFRRKAFMSHNVEQEMPTKYQVPYIPDHGICKLQRAIRR